jgi:hypothetical protein
MDLPPLATDRRTRREGGAIPRQNPISLSQRRLSGSGRRARRASSKSPIIQRLRARRADGVPVEWRRAAFLSMFSVSDDRVALQQARRSAIPGRWLRVRDACRLGSRRRMRAVRFQDGWCCGEGQSQATPSSYRNQLLRRARKENQSNAAARAMTTVGITAPDGPIACRPPAMSIE